MTDIRDPRTYAIIGAAMEVHTILGCGFLEPVYQEAMCHELAARDIPFLPQVELPVNYKDKLLKATYKPDFICYDEVIVELKALSALGGTEECKCSTTLKHRDTALDCSSTSVRSRCNTSALFSIDPQFG